MDRRAFLTLAGALATNPSAWSDDKSGGTGPWDLKELRKTPGHTVESTEEVKEGDVRVKVSSVFYEGEPWMGKPTRVFGYYALPAETKEKRLPAMVLVHGGGGTAFPQWARLWAARGYAALAMDLAGAGPDMKRLPDGGPDQSDEWKFLRLKDGVKNAWPHYTVAAVIRAASLLRSLPEVDGNRLGITGISWGGYLTTLVMSLDDRFKAAVPVYGCGFLHENSAWLPIFARMPESERQTWIDNFDPSRYLARCRTPVLWMNGTNDFAYPLDSYQKSYRLPKGPRTLCVTVKMPHGHPPGWARPEIGLFVDSFLKKAERPTSLTRIVASGVQGDLAKIAYDTGAAIQKAQIHWTNDLDKPWQQREWQTATGSVNTLTESDAPLPKQRPAVYFCTLTDHRGAVVSTEHAVLDK